MSMVFLPSDDDAVVEGHAEITDNGDSTTLFGELTFDSTVLGNPTVEQEVTIDADIADFFLV